MNDKQFGYFHITIKNELHRPLFTSNNERAFVISFLQQTLSMRTIIESPLGHQSLAAHIDLLTFSLIRSSCQLIVFGISRHSVDVLSRRLCNELHDYIATYQTTSKPEFSIVIKHLYGPHEALHRSVELHKQHEDWEYDRYSSIGFYLHDRRGDWMRPWRLAQLYAYNPENYRLLMQAKVTITYHQHATSSHA